MARPPTKPPAIPLPEQGSNALRDFAKRLSFVDLLVFLASEGVGAPLAVAGGGAAVNLLLRPALIGFSLGLPLMALGFIFPFVKHRLSDATRNRIAGIAASLTTFIVLSAFVYTVGPAIYRTVVPPPPPPAAPSTQFPPSAPVAPVRVDIVGQNFLPITSDTPLAMNFYYTNRSPTVPARGVVNGGKMIISPHFLTADEEKAITLLYFSKADFPGPNISTEMPPSSTGPWYTVQSDIDETQLQSVLDGKSFLYVFTYLKYGDPLSGLMTETEWCAAYQKNLNIAHGCLTFNRVFSVPSPKPYLP